MIRFFRCISLTLVFLIVSMLLILFFLPLPPLLEKMNYSTAVYDNHHRLLRLTLSEDAKYRLYSSYENISPQLISAAMLKEDQYFRWHPGVNPVSLVKAAFHTYFTHSRRMGASTITMQVARMRYGMVTRTWQGKLWQILRALQVEMHYSKNQIMEAYLNLAPFGNNIEGVGAASLIYFGKPVNDLSLPEILTLVVIPQHPAKRAPNQLELKNIRNHFYQRWLQYHPQDLALSPLFELPLQMRRLHDLPFLAPHFVNEVLTHSRLQHEIKTTLDYRLQKLIENITHQYLSRKNNLGVNNAAVLLVDSRDMSVKALLGSANFFNQKMGGQINGTTIRRSPGSTLKPFIYALALDQGLIHPATILKDVPHSFGSYNPENFDNDFMGPIPARDALVLSRNIPAITLADQLHHPSLYDFLQEANIPDLKSEEYYGLALVLGGAEVTMQELSALYSMLSNEGILKPLRFTDQDNLHPQSKRLLSREASFLVRDMLEKSGNAFKTGTSSGYRDAWTIGFFGPYVLAVWIGNFDNQGNPLFIGKQIAAPLFMDISTAIKSRMHNENFLEPAPDHLNLVKVDVCKASGMLPTKFCPQTEKVWFIPGKSPISTDTIYREIAIDGKTGLRACHFNKSTRFQVYEFWSSDLLRIFKRAGIERRIPPAYDPDCVMGAKAATGFSPQIISPQKQVNYVSPLAAEKDVRIPLSAVVDADVREVYWFVNETFLGKTTRDKSFWWQAMPGKYVIRVVDDYGRSDAQEVRVERV